MNEYDSNRIYDLAKRNGYEKTNRLEEANCYVLNTCHIREKATDKVYHDIGRLKKTFKDKKKPIVVVTGCVAQAEGEILLKKEKYIDAVIGPQSYHNFNNQVLEIEKKSNKLNHTDFDVIEKFDTLNLLRNSNTDISSFLTIQEGCDKFCKFCVVPYTRGAEYSRSIKELFNESKDLVDNGAREIYLLGQNVNAYNYNGKRLSHLINEISKIDKLQRIRYTTSHPNDFTDDLIEVHKDNKKLMPLLHLPIQSGSNKILKEMNRKHSVEEYLILIESLKRANPLIKFSSDFIIGYPGETEDDFKKSLKLLKKINYINTYSFNFSARPGTPAADLKKIDDSLAKKRLYIFQKLAEKIKMNYRKSLFNKKATVLFENKSKKENQFFGRDEFLNPIIVNTKNNLKGVVCEVRITDGNHNTLFGEIEKFDEKKDFAA